jgi:hypothetical protein
MCLTIYNCSYLGICINICMSMIGIPAPNTNSICLPLGFPKSKGSCDCRKYVCSNTEYATCFAGAHWWRCQFADHLSLPKFRHTCWPLVCILHLARSLHETNLDICFICLYNSTDVPLSVVYGCHTVVAQDVECIFLVWISQRRCRILGWSCCRIQGWSCYRIQWWSRYRIQRWSRYRILGWSCCRNLGWSRWRIMGWSCYRILGWSCCCILGWSRCCILGWSRCCILG